MKQEPYSIHLAYTTVNNTSLIGIDRTASPENDTADTNMEQGNESNEEKEGSNEEIQDALSGDDMIEPNVTTSNSNGSINTTNNNIGSFSNTTNSDQGGWGTLGNEKSTVNTGWNNESDLWGSTDTSSRGSGNYTTTNKSSWDSDDNSWGASNKNNNNTWGTSQGREKADDSKWKEDNSGSRGNDRESYRKRQASGDEDTQKTKLFIGG